MKYRAVPSSDFVVSEIGVELRTITTVPDGLWDFQAAERLLRQAYDQGVNFFDVTGRVPGDPIEGLIRKALPTKACDNLILAGGLIDHEKYSFDGVTPADFFRIVESDCDQTLNALEISTIGLYQFFDPPLRLVEDGTLEFVSNTLKAKGKIRSAMLVFNSEAMWTAHGKTVLEKFDTSLIGVSYGLNLAGSGSIMEKSLNKTLGWIVRMAFESLVRSFEDVRFMWEENGKTAEQFVLQFVLSKPWVSSVIAPLTASSDILSYTSVPMLPPLSEKEIEQAEALLSSSGLVRSL